MQDKIYDLPEEIHEFTPLNEDMARKRTQMTCTATRNPQRLNPSISVLRDLARECFFQTAYTFTNWQLYNRAQKPPLASYSSSCPLGHKAVVHSQDQVGVPYRLGDSRCAMTEVARLFKNCPSPAGSSIGRDWDVAPSYLGWCNLWAAFSSRMVPHLNGVHLDNTRTILQ